MTRLVELNGAGVSLGGRPVLRDIDFVLESGQVAGISGPNGSGKTTALRALASLTRIDTGAGSLLGADLTSDEIFEVRESVAMIGHLPALIGELSLSENLLHAVRLRGIDPAPVARVLEIVGLTNAESFRARTVSFGTQRRLEVARALLVNPKLLLLDEALSGLDAEAQGLIDALVERTCARGGGVVMVSHDPAQLKKRADSAHRIKGGRMERVA